MKLKYFSTLLLGCCMTLSGCSSMLDEDVYSQLDPGALFQSKAGIETVLFGAYNDAQFNGNFGGNIEFQEEWTCDQFWETGGAVNLQATVMLGFTWDAAYPTHHTALWNQCYASVRNCNLVLENIDKSPIADSEKELLKAEARFIRAIVYYKLYMRSGGVPLRTSTTGEQAMVRATDEEMKTFIETELQAVWSILPKKGELAGYEYGRATRGAALGFLCKFYLNTKQWEKCAQAAQQVIDLDKYELWPDYTTLFTVDNELVNKEYIWAYTCSPLSDGNELMNGSFPAEYKSKVDGSMPFTSNMRNWARMDRLWDSFYNSFDPADERRKTILTEYINAKGEKVSLLNDNNTRMFKYVPDPNANGNAHGNDIPVIRYADILLARAEALNEIASAPTQEMLDLIQQVRDRAGLTTKLRLADFTKESLRDFILQERGWEFYGENLRRQDLLRHGKFLEYAQKRKDEKWYNITVELDEHFKLFPIPQTEIDANPLCKQNPGY